MERRAPRAALTLHSSRGPADVVSKWAGRHQWAEGCRGNANSKPCAAQPGCGIRIEQRRAMRARLTTTATHHAQVRAGEAALAIACRKQPAPRQHGHGCHGCLRT